MKVDWDKLDLSLGSEFYQRNGYVSLLVNSIPDIENLSYLELGIDRGENFDTIKAKDKTSVDCDPDTCAQYYLTTDQFFDYNSCRYDIIFIDACHEYEQVLRDFQNALIVCDKFIFLHDMFPVKEEYTSPDKCGDAYKLLYYLIEQQHFKAGIRTLNTDCGLTVVKLPLRNNYLSPPLADVRTLPYCEFRKWAKKYPQYNLVEIGDFLSEKLK